MSRHSSYSLAARRVGDDAAAGAEAQQAAVAVGDHRADRDVPMRAPVGPGPADRAGVDAARRQLGRRHDLHRALLGRPRDRGAREERLEERGQRSLAARRDARGHLQQRRIALDLEERGGLDAAELGDAPEVVAQHVDDHQVLGALLLGAAERRGQRVVLLGVAPRAAVPFIGRVRSSPVRARRTARARPRRSRSGRGPRTPRGAAAARRRAARRARPAPPRASRLEREGEVDLVGVPRGDPLVEPRQPRAACDAASSAGRHVTSGGGPAGALGHGVSRGASKTPSQTSGGPSGSGEASRARTPRPPRRRRSPPRSGRPRAPSPLPGASRARSPGRAPRASRAGP